MGYKETLDSLSKEISLLNSEESIANLRIYKNNIFNLTVGLLKKNYPATLIYLGERNFIFFVRKMLLDDKIKSPNINNYIKKFTVFLEKNIDTHNDHGVIGISKVDRLWSYNLSEVTVSQGTFKLWSQLIGSNEVTSEINFKATETVFSYEVSGERYLSVK